MPKPISDTSADTVFEIFKRDKAVIGVIHCPAFPGAPHYRGAEIDTLYDICMRDAEAYIEGGLHGLIIENHGDIPFLKPDEIGPETTGFLSVVTDRVRRAVGVPIGINVLANAAIPAFAVAAAGGADFIRVNQWANAYVANEGIIEGKAAMALRYRALLKADNIKVFADSHVKHGSHAIVADRSIPELTRDLAFFDADAVIATGQRTGDSATIAEIDEIGSATQLPVLVGSGVTETNVVEILEHTQGVIVASSLKHDGVWWNSVDVDRVKSLMRVAAPQLEKTDNA